MGTRRPAETVIVHIPIRTNFAIGCVKLAVSDDRRRTRGIIRFVRIRTNRWRGGGNAEVIDPPADIIIEENSQSTKEQAINIIELAKKSDWKKIILIASHYHQPRAFLTFLKAMRDAEVKLHIINAPARELSWFERNPWGRRFDLLDAEMEKIERYKDDLASFKEGILHQQSKEARLSQQKTLKRKRH